MRLSVRYMVTFLSTGNSVGQMSLIKKLLNELGDDELERTSNHPIIFMLETIVLESNIGSGLSMVMVFNLIWRIVSVNWHAFYPTRFKYGF